jgi:hypothetical protein
LESRESTRPIADNTRNQNLLKERVWKINAVRMNIPHIRSPLADIKDTASI